MDSIDFSKLYFTPPMTETAFDIAAVEKRYKAEYVGDFCLKTKGGGWAESPAAIFWQETPPVEGYSNYFGLIYQNGSAYITSGASAFSEPIIGAVADDGEVVFSRYRHDYRTSVDGSVSIDGGRDYCRGSGFSQSVWVVPDGPMMKAIPIVESGSDGMS